MLENGFLFYQTCTDVLLELGEDNYGDFDPIFKVTGGLRMVVNGFLHPIS